MLDCSEVSQLVSEVSALYKHDLIRGEMPAFPPFDMSGGCPLSSTGEHRCGASVIVTKAGREWTVSCLSGHTICDWTPDEELHPGGEWRMFPHPLNRPRGTMDTAPKEKGVLLHGANGHQGVPRFSFRNPDRAK